MYISDSTCTYLANKLYEYWNTNLFMFSIASAECFKDYGEYEGLKVLEKFKRKISNEHIKLFSETYSPKEVYSNIEEENIPMESCLIDFETLIEFVYSTDPDDDKYEYDTPSLVKRYIRLNNLKTLIQVIEAADLLYLWTNKRLEIRLLPIEDSAFKREKELAEILTWSI